MINITILPTKIKTNLPRTFTSVVCTHTHTHTHKQTNKQTNKYGEGSREYYDAGINMPVAGKDRVSALYVIHSDSFVGVYSCNVSDFLVVGSTF